MRRLSFLLAVAIAATGAVAVTGPASASGLSPCGSRVINDWYDNGRIDHVYAVSCYRDALNHLPPDVEAYANAHDVIKAAMTARIAALARAAHTTTPVTTPPPETTSGETNPTTTTEPTFTDTSTTETKPVETTSTETQTTKTETAGPGPTSNPPEPPVGALVKAIGPKNATSIPVPLIVLGVLGLLLLAAGAAGVVARKLQERRTPATPGGSPPADTPPAA